MSATQTRVRPPVLTPSPEADWRRRGRRRLFGALLVVIALVATSSLQFRDTRHRYFGQPLVLVVEAPSAPSWLADLRNGGVLAEVAPLDLARRDLIVVPADATLEPQSVDQLAEWVSDGGIVVSPHVDVLTATGVVVGEPQPAPAVRQHGIEGPRPWPEGATARPLTTAADARPMHELSSVNGSAVASRHTHGDGRVLALGWDPFAGGRAAADTAPRLVQWIIDAVPAPPLVERDGLQLYFEPDLALARYGALRLDELADRLAVARLVHVSGASIAAADPADIDVRALVDALHDRGVLVNLWLAPARLPENWHVALTAADWDGVHLTTAPGPDNSLDGTAQAVLTLVEQTATANGWRVSIGPPVDDLGTPLDPGAAAAIAGPVQLGGSALAAEAAARAAEDGILELYALGVVEPVDLVALPRALTGPSRIEGNVLDADHPVVVQAPHTTWRELVVDGKPYPNAGGTAVVPAGRHTIEWRRGYSDLPGIVRTSVTLREVSASRRHLVLTYDAAGTGFVVLDREPLHAAVDGQRASLDVREHRDTFVVRVPGGDSVSLHLRFG